MGTITITVNQDTSSQVILLVTNEQSNSDRTIWTLQSIHNIGDILNVNVVAQANESFTLASNDPNYIFNSNYLSSIVNIFNLEINNFFESGGTNMVEITLDNITTGASNSIVLTRFID